MASSGVGDTVKQDNFRALESLLFVPHNGPLLFFFKKCVCMHVHAHVHTCMHMCGHLHDDIYTVTWMCAVCMWKQRLALGTFLSTFHLFLRQTLSELEAHQASQLVSETTLPLLKHPPSLQCLVQM